MCTAFKQIRVILEKNHDYVECEPSGDSAWYVIEDRNFDLGYESVINHNIEIEYDEASKQFSIVRVSGDNVDFYDDGTTYDLNELIEKIEDLIND